MWKRAESYILSQTKTELSEKLKEVFEEERNRYGAIQISKELQDQGIRIGRQHTQNYDKETNINNVSRDKKTILISNTSYIK